MTTESLNTRRTKVGGAGAVAAVVAIALGLGGAMLAGQAPNGNGGGHQVETPKLPDGQPDLTGSWQKTDGSGVGAGPLGQAKTQADGKSVCIYNCGPAGAAKTGLGVKRVPPSRPKYKPEFAAKVKTLTDRQIYEDPAFKCRPPGVPRIGPPARVFQTKDHVVFLYDDLSGNFFRVIPTDGRPHRDDTDASYLGDSVGKWEGDTLVIETKNFNTDSWLTDDGAFHTDKLRVVERIRRVGNRLEWQATAYDPDVLVEPWVTNMRTSNLSTFEIVETPPCIERDAGKAQNLDYHGNLR
jgi:hypothetical protein